MPILDVRDDPTLDPRTRADLDRVIAELEGQFPQLPSPVAGVWSADPLLVDDHGTPWLISPAGRDPLFGPGGPAVLPRRPRRELCRIRAAGHRFDAVAIAHELDAAGPAGALLPLLRDGPRPCTDAVARELVGPVPPHPVLARAVGILDALVGGDAWAWAGEALERILDPIVFGVVAPHGLAHRTPVVFQPLVAWRW